MSTIIFYMCYVQGGNAPKFSHLTEEKALQEATRLCQKEKKDVFILKAIKKIKLQPTPVVITELNQGVENASERLAGGMVL